MKKLSTMLVALVFTVLCGWVVVESGSAYARNTTAAALQARTSAVAAQGEAPKAQTFSGQITQAIGQYVLNSGGTSYNLDDQAQAKKFDGKQVTVTGTLDASTNTIHVAKIEAASA